MNSEATKAPVKAPVKATTKCTKAIHLLQRGATASALHILIELREQLLNHEQAHCEHQLEIDRQYYEPCGRRPYVCAKCGIRF